MTDITSLVDRYYIWLKDKTAWKNINDWVEITTPYIDRNNDYIQIYLKKTEDGYLLTDDGSTISSLKEEGCAFDSQKRQELLKLALAGHGVSLADDKLQVTATADTFAFRKHSLVQAILTVNDMFYLAEPHVVSLFFEDVGNWLDISDIRHSKQISFIGRSGYTRKFDFIISKSSVAPERIIKAINNPARSSTNSVIMDWVDTKDVRPADSKAYAIINDNDRIISSSVLDALNSYEIKPILWSTREAYKAELAA
jgi:hypothetical protein